MGTYAIAGVCAGQSTFHARVTVESVSGRKEVNNAGVVVWLTPASGELPPPDPKRARLAQHNKQFEPHLVVIPAGSTVDFPNEDPFFHNVFSLYKGKRFDLGLYEAGTSRAVKFEKPGVSFIFCNIHPEMSAVVMALPTPYFAISNASGEISIGDVPAGRYRLESWYERSSGDALAKTVREITLPTDATLSLAIPQTVEGPVAHKNKFGKDYDAAHRPYDH
jgi:plastocyanin